MQLAMAERENGGANQQYGIWRLKGEAEAKKWKIEAAEREIKRYHGEKTEIIRKRQWRRNDASRRKKPAKRRNDSLRKIENNRQ
jgi:hypothetical protein